MDLREIQRLHQQYAQGPLTIDMEAAPIAALPAPSARKVPPEAARSTIPPGYFVENRKVIALMVVVAAISLPVGMLLASANKHSKEAAATEPAPGQTNSRETADSGSTSARWPDTPIAAPVEPTQSAPDIAPPSVPAPASQAGPQSPATAASPAPQPRPAAHETKAAAREQRKPDAPVRAPSPTHKPAPTAGEIKLF